MEGNVKPAWSEQEIAHCPTTVAKAAARKACKYQLRGATLRCKQFSIMDSEAINMEMLSVSARLKLINAQG